MHIVRTIVWVLLLVALVIFIAMNWGDPVPVRIWPIPFNNPLLVEWPVALIAAAFFLIGFVPMWLYFRGAKWQLKRRIHSLEQAARHVPVAPAVPEPVPVIETPLATVEELPIEDRPPLA